MHKLFEYPYIIITFLVLFFLILGFVGIYFALQGVKTAKGKEENDFSGVNRIESLFEKLGKLGGNRSVIYISVSLDNARRVYSDLKADHIFIDLKPVFLKNFSDNNCRLIACYDGKNFVTLTNQSRDEINGHIEKCLMDINHCLVAHQAVKAVDIKFGIYIAHSSDVSFDEAINRAKQACAMAEKQNISYTEWNQSGGMALKKSIKIENNIEKEIENNHFFLEYQPVVDAKNKSIVGAEVLARLNSENDGVISPGGFLSAVDSVGINHKFDYYIFEKNCKWISNNKEQREKYVYTINFSRATLCDTLFAENVINIIEKYNLKYSSLAVEILEDKAITDDARAIMTDNLLKLKEKGLLILLDDFGSGYTTFGDLRSLNINTVKIDKSIISNANTEPGFLILKNIVRTAKELGFRTVGEGIETADHEKAAIEAGCDLLQGYYYYRPMPVTKLEELFDKN